HQFPDAVQPAPLCCPLGRPRRGFRIRRDKPPSSKRLFLLTKQARHVHEPVVSFREWPRHEVSKCLIAAIAIPPITVHCGSFTSNGSSPSKSGFSSRVPCIHGNVSSSSSRFV